MPFAILESFGQVDSISLISNMATEVTLNPGVDAAYQEMKDFQLLQYAFFKINKNMTEVLVGGKGKKQKGKKGKDAWDAFVKILPDKIAAFAIFDFPVIESGMTQYTIILISW